MPNIVPIVEGFGEMTSVPLLLRRILGEIHGRWDMTVGSAKNGHGCDNLLKPDGVERLLRISLYEPQCDGILVIIDADEKCPVEVARLISTRVADINPAKPVVVVIANCEYETWFLASLETIVGHSKLPLDVTFEGDAESITSPKGWLKQHMPKGTTYKETTDQVAMTAHLDSNLPVPVHDRFAACAMQLKSYSLRLTLNLTS